MKLPRIKSVKRCPSKPKKFSFLDNLKFVFVTATIMVMLVFVNVTQSDNEKLRRAVIQTSDINIRVQAAWDIFFESIEDIETGGITIPARGSAGEIGPYQITPPYWQDSKAPGNHELVSERWYGKMVMKRYFLKYCPDAYFSMDFEKMAAIHHAGPNGTKTTRGQQYGDFVMNLMTSKARKLSSKGEH